MTRIPESASTSRLDWEMLAFNPPWLACRALRPSNRMGTTDTTTNEVATSVSCQSITHSTVTMLMIVIGSLIASDKLPVRLLCSVVVSPLMRVSRSPIVERLKSRFGIGSVCIVADRGMISAETLAEVEKRAWKYILGVRMRSSTEAKTVVARAGRYAEVHPKSGDRDDPSPLKVKEVWVEDARRYVVCVNEDQATKDGHDREAVVGALRDALRQGDKSLVGNKGYRKYLRAGGKQFAVDEDKIKEQARYDGKWVLTTNTDLPAPEVALKYKQLWMVEDVFRSMKSLLDTRPIFHKCDETIRGHVFCSFLALLLRKELEDRLAHKKWKLEWADVIRDVDNIIEMQVAIGGKGYVFRGQAPGVAGKVFQACGVALPPALRPC